MTDAPRVERYVISVCPDCGEQHGRAMNGAFHSTGCDERVKSVEVIPTTPLSQLVSDWEKRADDQERRADHGTNIDFELMARADTLRSCAHALRELLGDGC